MSPEEILAELSTPAGRVPAAALREAYAQREALTEPLLAALRGFVARASEIARPDDEHDMLPDMAMYLLAQFREPRAFPLFEALCRLPEPVTDDWLGDMLGQDFASFLASTCGGQIEPLQRLAEDRQVHIYARWAALDALLTLVIHDAWPRESMIAWLGEIWPRWRDAGDDLTPLVAMVCDLRAKSLLPLAREAYAAKQTDREYVHLSELEQYCAETGALFPGDVRGSKSYVEDPATQMSWQAGFHEESGLDGFDDDDFPDYEEYEIQEPYLRPLPKIGRNDPCPCGSGKKYKKCCLQGEPAQQTLAPLLNPE